MGNFYSSYRKKKQNINNKSFFNKFLIKLIRKFGYEIIDQTNLTVTSKEINANQNLSESGKRSITVPLGETKITRKVESLTIIIRSFTFNDSNNNKVMLDQNKKRVFDAPKIEYTLRTIKSIIKSCEEALKNFRDIKIRLIISDDKSSAENLDKINQLLKSTKIESKVIKIKDDEFKGIIDTKTLIGAEL